MCGMSAAYRLQFAAAVPPQFIDSQSVAAFVVLVPPIASRAAIARLPHPARSAICPFHLRREHRRRQPAGCLSDRAVLRRHRATSRWSNPKPIFTTSRLRPAGRLAKRVGAVRRRAIESILAGLQASLGDRLPRRSVDRNADYTFANGIDRQADRLSHGRATAASRSSTTRDRSISSKASSKRSFVSST